jgi:putative DNA primase/helicase
MAFGSGYRLFLSLVRLLPKNKTKTLVASLPRNFEVSLSGRSKGCLDWQEQGLNPPQIVLDQVVTYKTEMDSIAQFVEQECDINPT